MEEQKTVQMNPRESAEDFGMSRAEVPPCAGECADCADHAPDAPSKAIYNVIDVRFRDGGKTYFFDPRGYVFRPGTPVVVDTSRGPEYGVCVVGNHNVRASEIVLPLRPALRRATAYDQHIAAENREREKRALVICQQKIAELGLDMQLVSAECAFDGSKLLFFFTSDGRVDFRELVRILASTFHMRIELRQIGVRDKAKMVGGLGICGRPFCCREFLDDFEPVSIKMAKTQNLSLNPTKISGTCGRLMCCLKYEQETYEDLMEHAPKPESLVDTPDGRGVVLEANLLRQSVRVRMEDQPDTVGTYKNDEIAVLRVGKPKKNDPPIPKDYAPISSQPKPRFSDLPAENPPKLDPVILCSDPSSATEAEPTPEQPEENPLFGRKRHRRDGEQKAKQDGVKEKKAEQPKDRKKAKQEGARKPEQGRKPEPTKQPAEPRQSGEPKNGAEPRQSGEPKQPAEPGNSSQRPDSGKSGKPRYRRGYRRKKPRAPGADPAE